MPAPSPWPPRRLPAAVRRRLEVATAIAWEALVEAHTRHALQFVALLAHRLPFDEAVDRYLRDMDVGDVTATAVRPRVLTALEDAERSDAGRPSLPAPDEGGEPVEGWKRFRPDVLMRGVQERHRRREETERWIQLAIARAEEGVISAHVDNAITFAATLADHMPLDRAIEAYIAAVPLTGGRAQAVLQRTLARLAEAQFPAAGPAAATEDADS
ncbi:MAG: hypothetical protein HY561_00125 [Gemmatimonadetes bacterium]|nr:hypothetical protein [Gemmatimonadota bacterium]